MIASLRDLVTPGELTQDTVRRALLVGWCVELVRTRYTCTLKSGSWYSTFFLLQMNADKMLKALPIPAFFDQLYV